MVEKRDVNPKTGEILGERAPDSFDHPKPGVNLGPPIYKARPIGLPPLPPEKQELWDKYWNEVESWWVAENKQNKRAGWNRR